MKSTAMNAEQKSWQAEDDLRALTNAAEVKADKARYAAAMKLAKEKAAALAKITSSK